MRSPRVLLPPTLALAFAACFPSNNVATMPEGPSGPTWSRDVQPLVAEHCQGCHTEGGIAPFPLDTYAQARPQAFALAAAVTSRVMPPWMPDEEGCTPLRESRRLSDEQVKLVSDWAEAGALEGAPAPVAPAKQER